MKKILFTLGVATLIAAAFLIYTRPMKLSGLLRLDAADVEWMEIEDGRNVERRSTTDEAVITELLKQIGETEVSRQIIQKTGFLHEAMFFDNDGQDLLTVNNESVELSDGRRYNVVKSSCDLSAYYAVIQSEASKMQERTYTQAELQEPSRMLLRIDGEEYIFEKKDEAYQSIYKEIKDEWWKDVEEKGHLEAAALLIMDVHVQEMKAALYFIYDEPVLWSVGGSVGVYLFCPYDYDGFFVGKDLSQKNFGGMYPLSYSKDLKSILESFMQ